MAPQRKPKRPLIVSPVGRAAYCWVNKPDEKFKKGDDPVYKVTLLLPVDDPSTDAFVAELTKLGKEQAVAEDIKLKKGFKLPIQSEETDAENDKETKEEFKGFLRIEAKTVRQPGSMDSKKNPLPDDVYPMSGDDIRFSATVVPYEGFGSGISLRLRSVQLLAKNHIPMTKGEEFGEYEGGYTAPANNNAKEADDDADF